MELNKANLKKIREEVEAAGGPADIDPAKLSEILERNGVTKEEANNEGEAVDKEIARLRLLLNPNRGDPRLVLALSLLSAELIIDQCVANSRLDRLGTRFDMLSRAVSMHAALYLKKARAACNGS